MQCSKGEFLSAIQSWRDSQCAVDLHTDEVNGTFIAQFQSASSEGLLSFSAHPLFQSLTIDLSHADEFELALAECEVSTNDSELVRQVADEIGFARVSGKLVFSMIRLIDPFADRLVAMPVRPAPKTDDAAAEPPIEE